MTVHTVNDDHIINLHGLVCAGGVVTFRLVSDMDTATEHVLQ